MHLRSLRMRNFSYRSFRENKTYFLKNFVIYQILQKNILEPKRPRLATCSMRNACGIISSKNTRSKYATHFFSICMKAAVYFVIRTLPVSLYWQLIWMNNQPNIYVLLASATVVMFIFVPSCSETNLTDSGVCLTC